MYLLTEELKHRLPNLGASDPEELQEATVHARFFDPTSKWRWYILEFDGSDVFLGIVVTGSHALVGNFTLTELQSLRYRDDKLGEIGVERDTSFEPVTVLELARNEPSIARLFSPSGIGLTHLNGEG